MTTLTATRAWAPPRTPPWWRTASRAALWTSLLLVVALWVGHGGVRDLTGGPGAALTSLGRLTGLVASGLLLVQVLLMARVPLVERSFGQAELARLHRLVGFTSFTLLLVHIGLVTVGYAASSGQNAQGQLWTLVVDYPGILLATAGTALLVLVTGTSIRAARRRLRYESWHLLHLYAYLGVGIALPHQLWTGGDFVATSSAAAFWWSLWAVAATTVVVFRLGLPLWRTLRHRLVVERVVHEAPGVVSVHVTGRQLHLLPARAGQFFIWRFLDGSPGWTRGHPWSLSAPVTAERLRITVKDLGDGSARLHTLRPGTAVAVEGPFGRLTADSRTRRHVVLVAAGVGIAPLRALAEELPYGPGEAVLLHRVRSGEELLAGELDELVRRRGLQVVRLVGPRPRDRRSWLPAAWATEPDADALRRLAPDLLDADVYVCGPAEWTASVLDAARGAGVRPGQLHTESFSW